MIPYERQKLIMKRLGEVELLKIDDLQDVLPDVSVSTLRERPRPASGGRGSEAQFRIA